MSKSAVLHSTLFKKDAKPVVVDAELDDIFKNSVRLRQLCFLVLLTGSLGRSFNQHRVAVHFC
jgi:hypothetical protein